MKLTDEQMREATEVVRAITQDMAARPNDPALKVLAAQAIVKAVQDFADTLGIPPEDALEVIMNMEGDADE